MEIDEEGEKSPSLHDSFFRQMMNNPAVQREFLDVYLPAPLKRAMDWNKIRLAPTTFITNEWYRRESDLLFELDAGGCPAFFYVLVEHQSQPDPLMPFRLLVYQVEIWRNHLKTHKGKALPYIHAIVLYSGKKKYGMSLRLKDLIQGPPELVQELWDKPFQLLDVMRTERSEVLEHIHLEALLTGFRTQFQKILDVLLKELNWLHEHLPPDEVQEILGIILRYGWQANRSFTPDMVADVVKKREFERLGGTMANAVQQLIDKGRNEGVKEGVQIGRKEGVKEGIEQKNREIARKMRTKGLSMDEIAEFLSLSPTEVQRFFFTNASP